MKYIHAIIFLMTHDLTELKKYWEVELIKGKEFRWRRLFRRLKERHFNGDSNFVFLWRLANEMFKNGTQRQKNAAKRINNKLKAKYNTEIQLGAKIGAGLNIVHPMAIEITAKVDIGENFTCLQFVTIGLQHYPLMIKMGNNVTVGCNSVVLGGEINIGNNVYIGAMSFVNKDLPDNCVVYTKKTNEIIIKDNC
ncbi:LbetaH domain-containing protein [Zophobihabitans entericus]|uniref:Serine acetyltransferase n=1 Tax=Zophobihabitans entericus TaxID=1635327 RepID=A0A6G9IAG1_9GAMM|nr:serine acetyltransferase [Zophobihabitans entericus]QIQ21211.1 serine acetyltransferase [Zophobihabitans entericus]